MGVSDVVSVQSEGFVAFLEQHVPAIDTVNGSGAVWSPQREWVPPSLPPSGELVVLPSGAPSLPDVRLVSC